MTKHLTEIPAHISPEAQAHAEKLGLSSVMHEMIDHMRHTVSGLTRVDATLEFNPWDQTAEPKICIDGRESENHRVPGDLRADRELGEWQITHYPPEIWTHFVLGLLPGEVDGR